jgi:hypothetical protein
MNDAPHGFEPSWQQNTGNGRRRPKAKPIPEPFSNVPTVQAWDAVCRSHPHIIAHISGEKIDHDTISLTDCVAAFYDAAAKRPIALFPEMLAAAISYFREGAFGGRAGTDLLIEDVRAIWTQCLARATEETRKRQEEAREQASWLTITDAPWDPDTLPPRPWLALPYLMRGEIALLHGRASRSWKSPGRSRSHSAGRSADCSRSSEAACC